MTEGPVSAPARLSAVPSPVASWVGRRMCLNHRVSSCFVALSSQLVHSIAHAHRASKSRTTAGVKPRDPCLGESNESRAIGDASDHGADTANQDPGETDFRTNQAHCFEKARDIHQV